jgi:toxin ParE1/3/4
LFAKRASVLRRAVKKPLDMPPKAAPAIQPRYQLRVAKAAQDDIAQVLEWTAHAFGTPGLKRYEALIQAALSDLATDPNSAGVRIRDDIGPAICTYHLASSRKRSSMGNQVAKPRHLMVFRVVGNVVQVARLLHDAMDFARHIPEDGAI